MRPRYETEEDLQREMFVKAQLEGASGATLTKLPDSYGPDFFTPGRIIEVKCRKHEYVTYSTLILALRKWRDGLLLALTSGGKFVVAAGFLDGIWTLTIDPYELPDYKVVIGGRTVQTRDDADIEPVVHLDLAAFKHVTNLSPWSEHD
jgi:hypothetical protein